MKHDFSILAITKEYQKTSTIRSATQLFFTIGSLLGLYALGIYFLHYSKLLSVLCMILAAGFVLRVFIIQHDCSHRSFFKSSRINDSVGCVLGVITLTPFYCWRRFHSQHHAFSGNLDYRGIGDINTLTVNEYLRLNWYGRLVYRVYRNPFVLFIIGPAILFCIRQRFTYYIPKKWKRERYSVYLTNLAICGVFYIMYSIPVLRSFLLFYLLAQVLASSLGVWLFYVQHQFKDAYWQPKEQWSYVDAALKGSTCYDLPWILHWLSGSIGFHHIHHLNPSIPNYQLKKCFLSDKELQLSKKLTFRESISCINFKLWDERLGHMVGFCNLEQD